MPYLGQEDRILAQRAISELAGANLKPDGVFGPATVKAIKEFQFANELDVSGDIDSDTWDLLRGRIDVRFLRKSDIAAKARSVGLLPSLLLAITENESLGYGFYPSGRCVILYERHKFYQYAKERYGIRQVSDWQNKYPNICHPVWDKSAYYGGEREWDRFMHASNLDATCAALATSWGMFQIMGFNYKLAGFSTIDEFVNAMNASEQSHLDAAVEFMKNQPVLWNAAKRLDFPTIAKYYNGASYAKNRYDEKLRLANAKYQSFNA